jgi:hypothetical protein
MSRILRRTALVLSLYCIAAGAMAGDRTRIANEGAIRDEWMLADTMKTLPTPGYPAEYKDRGDNVCVAVGYAIDPKTGKTSDFTLLEKWSSAGEEPVEGYFSVFATAAVGALSQWEFKPRPDVTDPRRTVTVATMTFTGKQKMDGAALRAHCRIDDLAATLRDAATRNAKDDRLRRDMEQSTRNANAGQAMISNPGQSTSTPGP